MIPRSLRVDVSLKAMYTGIAKANRVRAWTNVGDIYSHYWHATYTRGNKTWVCATRCEFFTDLEMTRYLVWRLHDDFVGAEWTHEVDVGHAYNLPESTKRR